MSAASAKKHHYNVPLAPGFSNNNGLRRVVSNQGSKNRGRFVSQPHLCRIPTLLALGNRLLAWPKLKRHEAPPAQN
jgi:hypothetical protein